jgi:REP element-mobilizing transposase RayT
MFCIERRMAQKNPLRSDRLPYYVSARANNHEAFRLEATRLWRLLGDELYLHGVSYGIETHACVLMPNEIHLLVTAPGADLGKFLSCLLSYLTKRANLKTGRSGRIMGGHYFWSLLTQSCDFAHVLKYIYRQPVHAALATHAESYPFSTLHGLSGEGPLPFPLHWPRINEWDLPQFLMEPAQLVSWINLPFPENAREAIEKGARRRLFALPRDRNTRRKPAWASRLI